MNASFLNSKTLSQILGAAIIPVSPLSPSFSVTHHQSADLVCHEHAVQLTIRQLTPPRFPNFSNVVLPSDNTAHKKELRMKLKEKYQLRRPSLFQPSSPPAPSSISSTQPCQPGRLIKQSVYEEFLNQIDMLNQHLIQAEERNNQTKQKLNRIGTYEEPEIAFKPKAAPVVAKINAKFSTNFQNKIDTEGDRIDKFFFSRCKLARWQKQFQAIAKFSIPEVRINGGQPELEKLESLAKNERETVAKIRCENEEEMKNEILVGFTELISSIEELLEPFR